MNLLRRLAATSVALRLGVSVTGAVVLVVAQGLATIAHDLAVNVVKIRMARFEPSAGSVLLAFVVVSLSHGDLLSFARCLTVKHE